MEVNKSVQVIKEETKTNPEDHNVLPLVLLFSKTVEKVP